MCEVKSIKFEIMNSNLEINFQSNFILMFTFDPLLLFHIFITTYVNKQSH
jgi:hypothetical protein